MVIKEMGKPTPALVQLVKLLQGGEASLAASLAAAALQAGLLPASAVQSLPHLLSATAAMDSSMTAALLPSLATGPLLIAPSFQMY